MKSTTLSFPRGADELRPFELTALKEVPGLGYYYPDLTSLRVEAQMLHAGPVAVETVSVFFKLVSFDGTEMIEIQDPLLPGVYVNKGYVWSSIDGTANATILEAMANGHKVIESTIDGAVVRFEFDPYFGSYFPVEAAARETALAITSRRAGRKAA